MWMLTCTGWLAAPLTRPLASPASGLLRTKNPETTACQPISSSTVALQTDRSKEQAAQSPHVTYQTMFLSVLSLAASVTLLSGQDVRQKPADIVEAAGHSVTIECTHRIPSYDVMLWYRQRGRGMQLIGAMYFKSVTMEPGQDDIQLTGSAESGETCKMVIPALHWNSSAVYYCAARIQGGTSPAIFGAGTRLTIKEPNVAILPPKVTIFPPSPHECTNEKDKETKKKTLVCIATDFYPDHINIVWVVDGKERVSGVAKDPEAQQRGGNYSISSRLRVSAHEWHSNVKFECVVKFFNGKNYDEYTEFIHGENAKEDKVTREGFLRLAQSARLSYGVLIAKSCVYAAFVAFLMWRLRIVVLSREKEQDRKDKNKSY